jgi:hypothetical protein
MIGGQSAASAGSGGARILVRGVNFYLFLFFIIMMNEKKRIKLNKN